MTLTTTHPDSHHSWNRAVQSNGTSTTTQMRELARVAGVSASTEAT